MTARPPLVILHSFFGTPELYQPWVTFFEAAGFPCHVPGLPGRDPTDRAVLGRTGVAESFAAVRAVREQLDEAPVVIGHSMGGLLGQKLAAETDCRALVLLASIPPGVLWPQLRSLPHLFPVLPAVLAGRPFLPSERTMRAVPLSTLPRAEQDELVPRLVPDSGRVFRSMTFGTPVMRVKAADVACPVLCVSGGSDRNVAQWQSRRIAKRYGAQHQVHADLPHWIIAGSAVRQVAPPILRWLRGVLEG